MQTSIFIIPLKNKHRVPYIREANGVLCVFCPDGPVFLSRLEKCTFPKRGHWGKHSAKLAFSLSFTYQVVESLGKTSWSKTVVPLM